MYFANLPNHTHHITTLVAPVGRIPSPQAITAVVWRFAIVEFSNLVGIYPIFL